MQRGQISIETYSHVLHIKIITSIPDRSSGWGFFFFPYRDTTFKTTWHQYNPSRSLVASSAKILKSMFDKNSCHVNTFFQQEVHTMHRVYPGSVVCHDSNSFSCQQIPLNLKTFYPVSYIHGNRHPTHADAITKNNIKYLIDYFVFSSLSL